jgi:uncharacterized protein (DUF983 family)
MAGFRYAPDVPYREAPSEAPCHQCERPARARCPVCEKPTCGKHLDERSRMCGKCDEAHYRFMHREDADGVVVQVLVVMALAVVPAVITTAMLPLTIAVVFLGFPGVLWYRRASDRRKFLTLMRTRGALPDPPSKISAADQAMWDYERKLSDRKAETIVPSYTPPPVDKSDA